jgi:hypothetical protein
MVYHVGESIRIRGGDGPPTPGGGARLLNRNQKDTARHQRVELALGVLDELAILLAAPTPLPDSDDLVLLAEKPFEPAIEVLIKQLRIHRFRRHLEVGDGLLAGHTRKTLQEIFQRVMPETIAAWLVDRGLVSPCIAAHAHAWRVHNGKQHLRLITVVVL